MAVVGLRDIYVAKYTEGALPTYGAPRKLAPALTVEVTPNFNSTTLYGDDKAVAVATGMGDIDITIGVADISSDDYAFLLGKSKNNEGVIEDSADDDKAPYVALGFRLPLEAGGFRYYWYYKGKFNPPSQSYATQGDSPAFTTPTISGKFMSREDGKWRAQMDSTDILVDPTLADGWFTNVYKPTPLI
jgi:phi13 family phage major tail protein